MNGPSCSSSRTTRATSSWPATCWSTPASSVVVGHDGGGGVRAVEDGPPDVILMDLQLPGIDGYAALQLIRGDGETASTSRSSR